MLSNLSPHPPPHNVDKAHISGGVSRFGARTFTRQSLSLSSELLPGQPHQARNVFSNIAKRTTGLYAKLVSFALSAALPFAILTSTQLFANSTFTSALPEGIFYCYADNNGNYFDATNDLSSAEALCKSPEVAPYPQFVGTDNSFFDGSPSILPPSNEGAPFFAQINANFAANNYTGTQNHNSAEVKSIENLIDGSTADWGYIDSNSTRKGDYIGFRADITELYFSDISFIAFSMRRNNHNGSGVELVVITSDDTEHNLGYVMPANPNADGDYPAFAVNEWTVPERQSTTPLAQSSYYRIDNDTFDTDYVSKVTVHMDATLAQNIKEVRFVAAEDATDAAAFYSLVIHEANLYKMSTPMEKIVALPKNCVVPGAY